MKNICFTAVCAAILLALTSCEPEVFSMFLDMRSASPSGFDLTGKTISVIYLDDLSGKDTVFNANIAQGFARALEEDYFDGKESVAVYKVEKDMTVDYASKQTLVNYAVESGDDVVFMFDSPVFEPLEIESKKPFGREGATGESDVVEAKAAMRLKLYAYDTMAEEDTVRTFSGHSTIRQTVICDSSMESEDFVWHFYDALAENGAVTGKRSASSFLSNWKTDKFSFYHADSPYQWEKASVAAYECRWREAIDTWMSMLDTKSTVKRAALEYNIAMAFYLLGDKELARTWSDMSEKEALLPLNVSLRKNLN